MDIIKKSKNKKNKKRKNKKSLMNIVKNYYYIGENIASKLFIVKKIDSEYIDQITLSTWKLICIWNDIYCDYKKLSKICSDLKINISIDPKNYILIDTNFRPICEFPIQEHYFETFKDILHLTCKLKVDVGSLKILEDDVLRGILQKFELKHKTSIVDPKLISIVNQYVVNNLDIFAETMYYRNGTPKIIMRYIAENYNIYETMINYKIYYIIQKDYSFYDCGSVCRMSSIEDLLTLRNYSNYPEEDNITILEINAFEKADEKNIHNKYTCLLNCPKDCIIKKIIETELMNLCRDICRSSGCYPTKNCGCCCSYFELTQFNKRTTSYDIKFTIPF